MKIKEKDYKLWDYVYLPFSFAPIAVAVQIVDKIIGALIPSLQVLVTAKFVDTVLGLLNNKGNARGLAYDLLHIVLLISYRYISVLIVEIAKTKMQIKLCESFQEAIIEKRAKLQYSHIENNETWDLVERVGKNAADKIVEGFDIVLRMGAIILRVGALMGILASQVRWASVAILVICAPLMKWAVQSGKVTYKAAQESVKYNRRANYFEEILIAGENIAERTLFGYAKDVNRRWKEAFCTAYNIQVKSQRNRYVRMKGASQITILMSTIIVAVLLQPLGAGSITVGSFIAFVNAVFGLTQMMSWELTYITSQLANNREYLRDLSLFSRLSEKAGAIDGKDIDGFDPTVIEFIDVSFAYPGTDVLVLKNFNLKISMHKHYAIVGQNGAGKTTITKLLTGLYDNYTGEIYIGEKNLREYAYSELKAMFAVVYQDFAKYRLRLADSIMLGNIQGCSEMDIMKAVEILGLTDVIARLPQGIATPIGKISDTSIDLSEGEWQRIAVARAAVSKSPIRIFDEPTASLDPISESRMYKLYDSICKGKTTIYITHRLGAAKLSDEIIVIDNGHVAEQGVHSDLIAKNGIYASMYTSQKEWYSEKS